ncbi:conserved exported hypothetical protein [Arthrobacter sp. 9AX]|uniref:hypothetical protein n=1 Tax=Arthrobacter sp. 9AX TaxID=2653131 RepID=UPI0012F03A5D|nr:hypothetical protein [Arthrobacter sp. 9AX]VXB76699.1 conserved exported hypothetical protein [Arthrobacter sp. 9AX]
MKKFWYLPIAAVVGATTLTVWGQANAGPPPEVTPGVVVTADVASAVRSAETESPATELTGPSPTASITAIPEHETPETELVAAELQTYAPAQPAGIPTYDQFDDKGGLRAPGVSDDGPAHDLGDDKGGLRAPGVSDDGPNHDLGDDKGGLRDDRASDDGPGHDSGDDKGGDR